MSKEVKNQYKGTIVPQVAKLINQCKGMERPYRIIDEESDTEGEIKEPKNQNRMTIVVNRITANYIRHYWG
mgnify:CR=1 FL=1